MRCKGCDYPLWQIAARVCPECGAPFKPSDYEFTLNSVRFCCPHCEQDYYGTGPTGHLVPRSFTCVRCNHPIEMDEMVLLPTEGIKEEQTETARQPWLERGQRRTHTKAFFATVGHALIKPGQLLKATPVDSGAWPATAFMLLTQVLTSLFIGVSVMVFFGLIFALVSSLAGPSGGAPPLGAVTFGMGAGFFVTLLVVWIVMLLLQAITAHAILRISGGCAHGIGRTWQALCYASGANIVSAVPLLGGYFGWIWWLVSGCVALKDAQKVHGGRATLAVLALPVISIVLFVGGYAAFVVYIIRTLPPSAFSAAGTVGPSAARTGNIVNALRKSPQPLTHAADILVGNSVTVWDFIDASDYSSGGPWRRMSKVPVGGITLDAFMTAPLSQQRQAAAAAAAALPANTIAYRFGDTVLTHPGIDVHSIPTGSAAEDLWIIVAWPESLVSGATQSVSVGTAGGNTHTFTASMMPIELAKQNQLRAQFGLPPIPDPATITHAAPAVGDQPPMLDLTKEPAAAPSNPTPPDPDP